MSSSIEVTTTTEVKVGPEELAEWFWHMSSLEQAEFFEALYHAIQRDVPNNKSLDEFATRQWYWLREDVGNLSQPTQLRVANMIRAVAAPFFTYTVGFDWERWPFNLPHYEEE